MRPSRRLSTKQFPYDQNSSNWENQYSRPFVLLFPMPGLILPLILLGRHQTLVIAPLEILRGETIRPVGTTRGRPFLAEVVGATILQTRLCSSMSIVARIATAGGQFRTLGDDCGLIMIYLGEVLFYVMNSFNGSPGMFI